MQRELVCDILALAAPDSMLQGYAQCWVDLVQALQPGQDSQEAASRAQLLEQHSSSTRLSFLVGAAAAPIISKGVPGMPSAKLAGRVLSIYMRPKQFRIPESNGIMSLLAGMLSAAPGATMAVVRLIGPGCQDNLDDAAADGDELIGLQAQKDDTREEVRLSKEAEMLGLAVVMWNARCDEAESWYDWINHTAARSELAMTVVAMSLTLAMSRYSWRGEYFGMPDILDLLEFLLARRYPHEDDDFDDPELFESSLVGALLGSDMKVVKIDTC